MTIVIFDPSETPLKLGSLSLLAFPWRQCTPVLRDSDSLERWAQCSAFHDAFPDPSFKAIHLD
jgi:hypothetical protein